MRVGVLTLTLTLTLHCFYCVPVWWHEFNVRLSLSLQYRCSLKLLLI